LGWDLLIGRHLLVGRLVVLHMENFEERVEDMKEQWVRLGAFSDLQEAAGCQSDD
jgi:hypothetical protein